MALVLRSQLKKINDIRAKVPISIKKTLRIELQKNVAIQTLKQQLPKSTNPINYIITCSVHIYLYTPCTKSPRTGLLINNNTNVLQHNKFEEKNVKLQQLLNLIKIHWNEISCHTYVIAMKAKN